MTQAFPRRLRAALFAGCALILSIPPALAQQTGRDPILVEGERLTPAIARERATAFVRATGVAESETPAARWTNPVCPRVLGLTPEGARSAENTIRAIATQVGAEVAPEGCDSNIVVMFTANAAGVVREIDRRDPRRLTELSPDERRTLLESAAPIRWWHTSEMRDTSGNNGRSDTTSAAQMTSSVRGPGATAGSDLTSGVPTTMRYSNSVISTFATRNLLSATVVIDQDAVMGRRLSTLAAYAALVALAEIQPLDTPPQGSILSMFGSAAAPTRLTDQDVGFLRTLYRMPLDRQARYHRGTLVSGMISATSAETASAD